MEPLELFVQSLKYFFLPALHPLGNSVRSGVEVNVFTLATSGRRQGTDQMPFADSRVPDELGK